MTPPPETPAARNVVRERALLAGAVVAGWVAHDLAVFSASGEPALAGALLPRSVALVMGGALFGALWGRWRWLLPAVLPPLALAAALPRLVAVEVPQLTTWLGRCLLVLAVALLVAAGIQRALRTGALRTGAALGVLAAVATASLWIDLAAVPSLALAGGALAALCLGLIRASTARRAATALVVLAAAAPVAHRAVHAWRPSRPDLTPVADGAGAAGPNLLLVVLDTVRADRLAPYGYGRVTTPALDAFVREHATLYSRARSASSWTLPSHASLFTGLMPAQHGATHPRRAAVDADTVTSGRVLAQRLRPDVPTLAELLRAAGYRTGGVLGNCVYLTRGFGLDRGYEHWDARPGGWVGGYLALAQMVGAPPEVGHRPYRDARAITDAALAWLAARDGERDRRPFFLTVNYMDAHGPLLPPAPFDRAFGGELPADPLRPPRELRGLLYDRELAWLDSQLARLLGELRRSGRFDDTVVIVTSDHGEALGDHGLHDHNWSLYEEVVRVPLYVKPAGGRSAEVRDEPVTGPDVFRIALAAVGVAAPERPPAPAVGAEWYRMLEPSEEPARTLTGNLVAWLESGRKVIVSSDGKVEAYDLERDPRELEPLALSQEEIEAALLRARGWWAAYPPPAPSGEAGALDAERLRALGYAGDD